MHTLKHEKMELVQIDQQHYIRMSDLEQNTKLSPTRFSNMMERYTFDCKPLQKSCLNGQTYISCKSACHFLEWYLDNSYQLHPDVNAFKHELKKYCKKIPKRVLSRSLRIELAYRQEYKCRKCGILLPPDFEVDHVLALEDGGQDVASNLQCLCVPCHSEKTRLNRLRKHHIFAEEAEAAHEAFVQQVQEETTSDSDDTDANPQIFSKYFSRR